MKMGLGVYLKSLVLGRHTLGGSQFVVSPGKKLVRFPSQQINQAWWYMCIIPAIGKHKQEDHCIGLPEQKM
jgi:hypothetical protein